MLKFIDLNSQYERIKQDVDTKINTVLNHGLFIKGPEVAELEKQLAAFVGCKHAIAVANGTDALQIALMALNVGPGDEVIVPAFTFIAPAEVVKLVGATPVFVDIDSRTYNLDANLLEQAISEKTRAIMPVSLYGQCADFTKINEIAKRHNLPVIEDAAQSFGAKYKGTNSCNLTEIACTSFFPAKPLGCYGDGGACFTNDDGLAEQIRCIADHGQSGRYNHIRVGLNSRLDTIQAAVLLAKLTVFPWEIERRNEIASQYSELLKAHVTVPFVHEHNVSVFAQYTLQSPNRAKIQQALQDQGVPTAVHYPVALNDQPVFVDACRGQKCQNASMTAERVISLPFHPYLKDEEVEFIANKVIEIIA